MNSQLEDLDGQFQAVSDRARHLALQAGLKLAVRPSPNRWSAAECLSHLQISSEAFFPILDDALASARKKGLKSDGPYRLDFMGKLLIWTLEPPPKFKFPAPSAFQPQTFLPEDRALHGFLESQERVRMFLKQADGLALDRIKIRSPFDQRVRYSVWSALRAAVSHQRRHLWQAEQTIRQIS